MIVLRSESSQCLKADKAVAGAKTFVAACDLDQALQRWLIQNSQIQLENTQLCLSVNEISEGQPAVLSKCQKSPKQRWIYRNHSFIVGELALDFTDFPDPIAVFEYHGRANQRWEQLSQLKKLVTAEADTVVEYPIPLSQKKKLHLEFARDIVNRLTPLDLPLPVKRDLRRFPGLMPADVPVTHQTFKMDRRIGPLKSPGWAPPWHQKIFTGLWARAGEIITIDVKASQSSDLQDVYLQISEQDEALDTVTDKINDEPELQRFASISVRMPLKLGTQRVRSPYGGFIMIGSKKYADARIEIEIRDAVKGPYFNTTTHSLSEWNSIKNRPGPWVTIEGRRSVISVPKEQVAQLTDPAMLMGYYDSHIEDIEWLAGFDGNGALHPKQSLKHHLIWSPQISSGYAHADFPIRTTSDWRLADLNEARTSWGNVHELGHLYQQDTWCQTFGGESSVNLFSLYALERFGIPHQTVEEDMYFRVVNKLKSGAIKDFVKDADEQDKLIFLMQIVDALPEQGWKIYRELFRRYRELSDQQMKHLIDQGESAQINKHYELISEITGYDFKEHYQRWGMKLSEASLDKVRKLKLKKLDKETWYIVRRNQRG